MLAECASAIMKISLRTGVPGSRHEKKQVIDSWKRHALCDSVLRYERKRSEFNRLTSIIKASQNRFISKGIKQNMTTNNSLVQTSTVFLFLTRFHY